MKELLNELRMVADVLEVAVTDSASALEYGFLGSPTVRINGIDVEPSARMSDQFGLMCRTYLNGTKREGVPSIELMRQALEQAQWSESEPQCGNFDLPQFEFAARTTATHRTSD